MSLYYLFPQYPLKFRSPPESRLKFETRSIYVDFPWPFYRFLQDIVIESMEKTITKEEIKRKWNTFMQKYRDNILFHGKPLGTIFARRFQDKICLRLNVKWNLFIEYLEEKARKISLEVEKNGENIKNLYKYIWSNFFNIIAEEKIPRYAYLPSEKFKKLLQRTGDYYYLEKLLDQFEKNLIQIIRRNDILPTVQLYILNMLMDVRHLRTLVYSSNIPEAYLLLRNFLETLIKLFVYVEIGAKVSSYNTSIDIDLILYLLFRYEYELRDYYKKDSRFSSLDRFIEETSRKFIKIFSSFRLEENINLNEFIDKMRKKVVPALMINKNSLKEFCKNYDLEETKIQVKGFDIGN